MKRDIEKLSSKKYDLLIIGGGISGACVAHDAVLRGLSVALVEMKDFSWATSAATSKLIHGGLRYLKNLEFGLVRESLRERKTMEIIAPHLVYPLPFMVPTYKNSSNARYLIYPGMALYDILSYDKAQIEDPDRKVPHFELLSVYEVLEKEPDVNPAELTGGAIYYDCQMYSPERLALAFLQSAAKNGANLANYARVMELKIDQGRVLGAKVRDELTGDIFEVEAELTVNVTGPWADFVFGMGQKENRRKIVRSEGIHIITRQLVKDHAVVYRTQSGRHFFIIPWRGKSLIGTTDTRYEGSPDEYVVTKANVVEFINEINESHPAANLTLEDVEFAYGGLRPIVEDETDIELDVYDKSRKYEIYDHSLEGEKTESFLSVIGGKYTTSRALAQNLVDLVFKKLNRKTSKCVTDVAPLEGGNIKIWDILVNEAKLRFPNLSESSLINILHCYGSNYDRVLEPAEDVPELFESISAAGDAIMAQVKYAAQKEMAITLEDIVFRRTDLAMTTNELTRAELHKVAQIMGEILGWDDDEISEQVEKVWSILEKRNILAD